MADAFVAVADDATAASWNPAGLIQLERPEISIVGSYFGIFEDFEADSHSEFESAQDSSSLNLNFLSVVFPIPARYFGRRAAIGLSYQRKFDFSRAFDIDFNSSLTLENGTEVNSFQMQNFQQDGGLSTITPTFALEIFDKLSVGVSFNLWRSSFLDENGWSRTVNTRTRTEVGDFPEPSSTLQAHEEYNDLSGENYVIGLLWKATNRLTFGARYDSSFKADVDYEASISRDGDAPITTAEERKVKFPDTIALGASFRANDRFTIALDLTRTDWNDFYIQDAAGTQTSIIYGGDLSDPDERVDLDPTYTVRLGVEYVFIPEEPDESLEKLWSLRGGVFYDQEPASGRSGVAPTDIGDGNPDDFFGIAIGTGLLAFQRVNFDFAYQLRYGSNVNSDFVKGVEGFREDVLQHRFLLSTVIYF